MLHERTNTQTSNHYLVQTLTSDLSAEEGNTKDFLYEHHCIMTQVAAYKIIHDSLKGYDTHCECLRGFSETW